ncbi:hypothetical protein THRCLA_08337 [Thraustotheca clavata]|uniref:Uncharacterized protein n=1 Tax=Thraustotheca clavata TaxID=74557 RepID=A0A1V9Z743_9STRA|nr:hypothetical protein THRCLA_08337 [Thraustotheca clavata]
MLPTSSMRSPTSSSTSSSSTDIRRYSFADYRTTKMTEALVFSWNYFLCPSYTLQQEMHIAVNSGYQSSNRLANLHKACAQLDPEIASTLYYARSLGYLYVLVENSLDDFQAQLDTFFPKTARLIADARSNIQLACALKSTQLQFMYEHLLYSICTKSARLQLSTISLTVFGPEELRLACLTIARSLTTVVPKTIRTTSDGPASFVQVNQRLYMVRQHLEGIVMHDTAMDMPMRPIARPRSMCF